MCRQIECGRPGTRENAQAVRRHDGAGAMRDRSRDDGTTAGRGLRARAAGARALSTNAQQGTGRRPATAVNGVYLYVQVRVHGIVQRLLVARMLASVAVADRTFLLRKYRRCFVGADAAAFLVSRRFARTVPEAEAVGNALLRAGVFRHVRGEFQFRAGHYFYRFAAHEDYAAIADDAVALRSSRLMSVATAPYASAGAPQFARGTMSSDDTTFSSSLDVELEGRSFDEGDVLVDVGIRIGRDMFPDLVSRFSAASSGLVASHRVAGRLVHNCFVGAHASRWLQHHRYVATTRDAAAVGNAMLQAGVFFPLDDSRAGFACDGSAYRMVADVDLSAALRRGQKKDFLLRTFLGIDRTKAAASIAATGAPWFDDSLSFTTNSSFGH